MKGAQYGPEKALVFITFEVFLLSREYGSMSFHLITGHAPVFMPSSLQATTFFNESSNITVLSDEAPISDSTCLEDRTRY